MKTETEYFYNTVINGLPPGYTFCASEYKLIQNKITKTKYRYAKCYKTPKGWTTVKEANDANGDLKMEYWALARLIK